MKARKVLAGALALSVILTGMPIMSARTLAAEEQMSEDTTKIEPIVTYEKLVLDAENASAYADSTSASGCLPQNLIIGHGMWHTGYSGSYEGNAAKYTLRTSRMTSNNNIYLTLRNASTITKLYYKATGTNYNHNGRIERCSIYIRRENETEFQKIVDDFPCYYHDGEDTVEIPFAEAQDEVKEVRIEVLNTTGDSEANKNQFISGKSMWLYNADTKLDIASITTDCTSHVGQSKDNLIDDDESGKWHSSWTGDTTCAEGTTIKKPVDTEAHELTDKNNLFINFPENVIGQLGIANEGYNGRITVANIYVSNADSNDYVNIKDWKKVATVNWQYNVTEEKLVTFEPVKAKHIRVEVKQTKDKLNANPNTFITASKIGIYKAIVSYPIYANVADEVQGTANVKIKDSEGQGTSSVSAVEGTELTFTAEPAEGYKFTNWTEDGQEISADNPYDYTVGQSGKILTANFAVDKAELESVLAEADKITDLSEYQDGETKESYQAALSKAREVDKNENATVAEVTEAKSALETALAALESIKEESITATAKKAVYNVGDTVEATVSVVYKNKGTSDVTEKSTVTCNTEKTGTPEATVTYKNFSTTFSVLVVDGVALDSAITVATAKKTDGNRYLATTFSELEKELSAAETVQNDIKAANGEEGAVASGTEVTPERVAEATKNLNDAVDNLEKLCKVSVSAGAAVTAENTEAETDDAGNSFVYVEIGTKVTISASATSGEKKFTGWKWNDNVISTSAKYTLYAVEDMEITPSYEANEKAEEVKQMFTKRYKSGKHCFIAKRSVPKTYKVSEYGVVITDKTGWDYYKDHEEAFKKGAIRTKWTCKAGSANNGTFEARLSGNKSTKYYAKAYVTYTYEDTTGTHEVTEYTDGFVY